MLETRKVHDNKTRKALFVNLRLLRVHARVWPTSKIFRSTGVS